MATKTVDALTVITTLNSADKVGVWKNSSSEYCGIAYSDLLTGLGISAYLKLDGSTTMTGTLAMGTHAISGVTTLAMGGALSGVTTIVMSSTLTGVTGITMSGTLAMNTNAISGITTLNGTSITTGFILAAGTVALTGNWDIGVGRKIQGERIEARSNLGLKLYEDGGTGLFVQDSTGFVGVLNNAPSVALEVTGAIKGNADTDTASILGRASVGFVSGLSDCAAFSHVDFATSGNYAFIQTNAGLTIFNSVGNLYFRTSNQDKMIVLTSGEVGIGLTLPTAPLHVYNATTSQVLIDSVAATGVSILSFNSGYDLWRPANASDLIIGSYPSNKFITITALGKIGINTQSTTPDSIFHVMNASAGSVTASTDSIVTVESGGNSGVSMLCPDANESHLIFGRASSNNVASIKLTSSGTSLLQIMRSNAAKISIDATGNMYPVTDNSLTIGASGQRWSAVWAANATIQTSDMRLKTKTKASNLGLAFVKALKPLSWVWEDAEHGRIHHGLAAQDVKQTMDDQKTGDFGGYVYDPATDIHSLRYAEFTAPLINAIQEQQSLIEKLTQTVSELMSKVQSFQGV